MPSMLVPGEPILNVGLRFNRVVLFVLIDHQDSEEQIENFKKDPASLAKYSRNIEGELNKRFTLVSALFKPWKFPLTVNR